MDIYTKISSSETSDISIYECDKYYPAFQQVLFDDMVPQESLKLSNFEIIGRA